MTFRFAKRLARGLVASLGSLCASCAGASQNYVGAYSSGTVDTQSQIVLLADKTFCLAFMGGSLDSMIAGRWEAERGEPATLRLRQERSDKPAFGAFFKPGVVDGVVFDFDGYSVGDAVGAVFGVSDSDALPSTLRPLLGPPESGRAVPLLFRLSPMPSAAARYFYVGYEAESADGSSSSLRVTQYRLPAERGRAGTVFVVFDEQQAKPPLNMVGVFEPRGIRLDHDQVFHKDADFSAQDMQMVRERCVVPALTGKPSVISPEERTEHEAAPPDHGTALVPVRTFEFAGEHVRGEPYLGEETEVVERYEEPRTEESAQAELEALRLAAMKSGDVQAYLEAVPGIDTSFWQKDRYQRSVEFAELIHALFRGQRPEQARQVFDVFVERVGAPLEGKSADPTEYIAADMLVIAGQTRDAALVEKVRAQGLHARELAELTSWRLLFNLACYFALVGDKPQLLTATRRALELGTSPELFQTDADFTAFRKDRQFIRLLASTPASAKHRPKK